MPADTAASVVPRLAIVGANSLLGKEIKEQLAGSGYPSAKTTLFELEELAGLLTDYGTEARVINETVAEQVLDHEIVCFCGDPGTARDYLERLLTANHLGLDCTGAWLEDDRAFGWIPGINTPPRISEHRALVIPPATSILLAGAMVALGDAAANASANVFVPASERGDDGLSELSQQSTAILGLAEIEDGVFGRQLAFDVWVPPPDDALGAERVAATLKWLDVSVPAINIVAVPVFHGMALSLFLPGAAADDVAAALSNAGFSVSDEAGEVVDSPVRVAGIAGIHTISVRDDVSGVWVWAVTDNLHARAAAAVAAIHTLAGVAVSASPQ